MNVFSGTKPSVVLDDKIPIMQLGFTQSIIEITVLSATLKIRLQPHVSFSSLYMKDIAGNQSILSILYVQLFIN